MPVLKIAGVPVPVDEMIDTLEKSAGPSVPGEPMIYDVNNGRILRRSMFEHYPLALEMFDFQMEFGVASMTDIDNLTIDVGPGQYRWQHLCPLCLKEEWCPVRKVTLLEACGSRVIVGCGGFAEARRPSS